MQLLAYLPLVLAGLQAPQAAARHIPDLGSRTADAAPTTDVTTLIDEDGAVLDQELIERSSTTNSSAISTSWSGGKRGLSYEQAKLTLGWGTKVNPTSQVSWAYNWYFTNCGKGISSCTYNNHLDYIPMLFNTDPVLTTKWTASVNNAIKAGSTALFSFNEPDLCAQDTACMTVAQAVAGYKKYIQPFHGRIKLGSPAITNGAAPHGLTYLSQFLKACTGCRIDFINVHWYSNHYAGATYFEDYMMQVKKIAGNRPVWVSEYGLTSDNPYTEAQLTDFLKTTMAWMDQQPWIHRYAYYMDKAGVLLSRNAKTKSVAGHAYDMYVNKTTQPFVG